MQRIQLLPSKVANARRCSAFLGIAWVAKSKSSTAAGHYNANYGNFQTELYSAIRQEAFGQDIGQNSWLTADEQDRFLAWLDLSPGKTLLDIACGAGGPALRIAAITGCSVVGIDIHADAIVAANALTTERGLNDQAKFQAGDATGVLPFSDSSFDAITCIDAVNHLPDRPRILAQLSRLLKPKGRLLFTDPITLTGPITNEEVAIRSAAGFYVFVPPSYDHRVIEQSGLKLLVCEDVSANMGKVAEARRAARERRSVQLREIEGSDAYERQQEFLTVTARLAKEGRMSRFVYVSEKS